MNFYQDGPSDNETLPCTLLEEMITRAEEEANDVNESSECWVGLN